MTNSDQSAAGSTRDRLIEAARQLFYERGYHATALNDVLERAKANSGSMYYFFKTKEDLVLAVLDRYVELLMPVVMEPAFAATDDPIERIFAVLESYRRGLIANEFSMGCPIGNLALELADTRPAVREKVALNFANWCRAIQKCLDDAADRFPPDVDRERLSRFVLTLLEGGIMQTRAHRSIRPFEEAVAVLRDYFDRLLKTDRPRATDGRIPERNH
jgi:TetR/AcrR family transcriptional repressor of nem operon